MKRVLLISNYVKSMGGIHAQVEMLHHHLNLEDGYMADIFSTKGNPFIRIWKLLCLLCVSKRYDILHIHACSYRGMLPAVFGIIAGKMHRKKIIITYHGGEAAEYFAKQTKFVRKWLGKADQVVVLSGFLKEIFDRYAIPCIVIPNIIHLHPMAPREKRLEIAPRFISIRHLRPLYNIPCILKAYKMVLERYPNATLDILGQGDMRTELKQYVTDNHLTGVRFLGQVPNDKIYDYFAEANIILSAPKADNMPVSLLEAMNAGLLVIASRVGGVPYMIVDGSQAYRHSLENGECAYSLEFKDNDSTLYTLHTTLPKPTGLLFESDNADELAEKMLWALEHPEEVHTMIINAQKDVQKYSWKNIKQQLFEIYE